MVDPYEILRDIKKELLAVAIRVVSPEVQVMINVFCAHINRELRMAPPRRKGDE